MKKELPKTEVDWSKFPKATQEKVKMEKLHNKIINGFQEEHKQDRTCTNNCSVVCGECQIFKPKQETLEEVGTYQQELFNYLHDLGVIALQSEMQEIERIVLSVQQERMYSEEKIDKILQKLEEIKIMINIR